MCPVLATVAPAPGPALIVDADLDTREMYAAWLAFSGFNILQARTADEALAHARTQAPSVITLEIGLAGAKDGCELCVALKEDASTRAIPILVVTAWALGGHIERARLAGCDAVLVKPVSPQVLLDEIHRLLGRTA